MFFFFITHLSLLCRRLIGDWSAISRGPVPDRSATSCIKSQRGPHEVADQSPISRRPVPDQSPTSRRPTAKPSCDSSATSAIVMNFGRGEVAERLQRMSDLGFTWILDKGFRSLFKKGPTYRLQSRIDFIKCRSIVEEALQTYCKRWCKNGEVGVHALNDWKN